MSLNFCNYRIDVLPELPSDLKILDCLGCPLLTSLPSTLTKLYCGDY